MVLLTTRYRVSKFDSPDQSEVRGVDVVQAPLLVLALGRVTIDTSNLILLTPFTRSRVYEQDALSLAEPASNPSGEGGTLGKKNFSVKGFNL
jgi:hypothetical protein